MTVDASEKWEPTDENLFIIFNHTAMREYTYVNVTNDGQKTTVPRDTLLTLPENDWQTGDNALYNSSSIRQIEILFNGKNETRKTLTLSGYACLEFCPGD